MYIKIPEEFLKDNKYLQEVQRKELEAIQRQIDYRLKFKLIRLQELNYPKDFCEQVLNHFEGNEKKAKERLLELKKHTFNYELCNIMLNDEIDDIDDKISLINTLKDVTAKDEQYCYVMLKNCDWILDIAILNYLETL